MKARYVAGIECKIVDKDGLEHIILGVKRGDVFVSMVDVCDILNEHDKIIGRLKSVREAQRGVISQRSSAIGDALDVIAKGVDLS